MKNVVLLAVVAFITLITPLKATDFVAKKLEVVIVTSGSYQLRLLVRNDNILADAFAVQFMVWAGTVASGQPLFSYTQDESTLAPFTERTVTAEQEFSPPTTGTYTARATILYESEIDPPDNAIDLIFEALRPPCDAAETWHAGPALVIEQPLRIWPDTPMAANNLRPGDVIGISALVTDLDILEERCGCLDEDTSVLRGPYPDDVAYEWSLSGPGTLLQSTTGGRNTVMYQLPVCPPGGAFSAAVSLRVRNGGGKADDAEVAGSVAFSFNTDRRHPPGETPSWSDYTYDVNTLVDQLDPRVEVPVESRVGRACKPLPPVWEKGAGITVTEGLKSTSAPFLCPEYLTLVTVNAADVDSYSFVCEATPTSCSPNDTLKNTSADRLSYVWSIIGGAGELPLPTTGPAVVVRRSATQPTILQCVINDGGAQADDDPVTVLDTLPAVGKPKAFVGLGDDEGTSVSKLANLVWDYWVNDGNGEDVYGGRSGTIDNAWETMVTKLTDAGYEVISDDSMLVTRFESVISNPCIKVFAFVGHGSSGHINMARMDIGGWSTPTRGGDHVRSIASAKFNCERHPFLRDLVLLACETMQGSWGDTQVYGRSHGWTTTKKFASLRAWAYWSYQALPPIILTVD